MLMLPTDTSQVHGPGLIPACPHGLPFLLAAPPAGPRSTGRYTDERGGSCHQASTWHAELADTRYGYVGPIFCGRLAAVVCDRRSPLTGGLGMGSL